MFNTTRRLICRVEKLVDVCTETVEELRDILKDLGRENVGELVKNSLFWVSQEMRRDVEQNEKRGGGK